jgi:hypothetical protein
MFPETDLNMDTLRQLAQSMNSQQAGGTGTSQQAIGPAPIVPPPQPSPSGSANPEEVRLEMVTQADIGPPPITAASVAEDLSALPESGAVGDPPHILGQAQGCLIIDSLGTTSRSDPLVRLCLVF